MNYIVTNNPLVVSKYEDVIFVEGKFIDVLETVRAHIHLGNRLVSAPLGASIRMLYSPVKSVILATADTNQLDEDSLFTIENSIEKYQITMGQRLVDTKNQRDYEVIDEILLTAALEEQARFSQENEIERMKKLEIRI